MYLLAIYVTRLRTFHIIWMYCCCCCCVFSFNDSLIPYYAYLGSSSAYINDISYIWRYTLAKRVEIFPWIFTIDVAFMFRLRLVLYVRKYFIILFTIFFICSFDWNSFFVNANKSIIYHQTGFFLRSDVVQKWWEN